MTEIRFHEVRIRGVRRWKTADGKKHQETRKFFQTLNPFNKGADGMPKTLDQIRAELIAERVAWLKTELPK